MSELQELNEKLARWAGFALDYFTTPPYWVNPHGEPINKPPDFTTDLNAQVKWLWPKLDCPSITFNIELGKCNCELQTYIKGRYVMYDGWANDNEPALAAARAIEQVIDSGG